MADELPGISAPSSPKAAPDTAGSSVQRYGLLRWTIRLVGFILMLGGVAYLALTAGSLLLGRYRSHDLPYVLVISLIALGLGILALRIGFRMLLLIDASTISQFSFIFAVIYTFVLMHVMPLSGIFQSHLVLTLFLVGIYLGLSYWILKRILSVLLLPPAER